MKATAQILAGMFWTKYHPLCARVWLWERMCVHVHIHTHTQEILLCMCRCMHACRHVCLCTYMHSWLNLTTLTDSSTLFSHTQSNHFGPKPSPPNTIPNICHPISLLQNSVSFTAKPHGPSSPTQLANLRLSFRPSRERCTQRSPREWAWDQQRQSPCRASPGMYCCWPCCLCCEGQPTVSLAECSCQAEIINEQFSNTHFQQNTTRKLTESNNDRATLKALTMTVQP